MSFESDEEYDFNQVVKQLNEDIKKFSAHVDKRLESKDIWTEEYIKDLVSLRKELYDIQLKLRSIM